MTISFDDHSNFAYSTIQAGSSIIGSAGSPKTIVLASGDGASFPSGNGTDQWNVVIWPPNARPLKSNAEIVRVTRSGDTLTTTARGQEGTSALSTITAGYQVMAAVTDKTLTDIEAQLINGIQYQVLNSQYNLTVANSTTETTLATYTVTANTLGTAKRLLFHLEGDWKQNAGAAQDWPRLRVKLAGVTILDTNVVGGNPVQNDTVRYPWFHDIYVSNLGVTNQQRVRIEGVWNYKRNGAGNAQFAVGTGATKDTGSEPQEMALVNGANSAGADTTANMAVDFTIQLPSAVNNDILAKVFTVALIG